MVPSLFCLSFLIHFVIFHVRFTSKRHWHLCLKMKTTFFFLAILASACIDTIHATKKLDESSFQKFKESGNNGIIKFYQDWCGHCKRMKPDWDALANEFGDVIMDVDCGDQKEVRWDSISKRNDVGLLFLLLSAFLLIWLPIVIC